MKSMFLRSLIAVFILSTVWPDARGDEIHEKKQMAGRIKRDFSITKLIELAIKAGESLSGTSLDALRDTKSDISVVGEVDNPSKWMLRLVICDMMGGKMNNPMFSVSPAQKEAFASHDSGGSLDKDGTSAMCTFRLNNRSIYIHIAYNIPQDGLVTTNANVLAFAVCHKNETECVNIKGAELLEKNLAYLKRRVYKDTVSTMVLCREGICLTGTMGTSKKSKLKIKVYPEQFENLEKSVRDRVIKGGASSADYQEFIEEEIDISESNRGDAKKMSIGIVLFMVGIAAILFT